MLSSFFPLLCTLLPLSLLLCCVRGQRVERMPRTLGLCDWKHIVSHFNIYDKMPVALCHSLGLYLTPNWQICQEFFQSLCPCHSTLLFLIAFSIWGVQRASPILEHTKILRNAIDVLRPTPRGIFPLNFLLVSLCFFCCASCVTPLYWLLSTSTALYQPQIPQLGPHIWWAYRKTQSNC